MSNFIDTSRHPSNLQAKLTAVPFRNIVGVNRQAINNIEIEINTANKV